MVLRNFVDLQTDVPAVMHFRDHFMDQRVIVDPQTRREKTINVLVFEVDRLAGEAVATQFSVLSEKLARTLEPWLENRQYVNSTFIITRRGSGFTTEFEVQTEAVAG